MPIVHRQNPVYGIQWDAGGHGRLGYVRRGLRRISSPASGGNVADQVWVNTRKLVEMWPFLNLDPWVKGLWNP